MTSSQHFTPPNALTNSTGLSVELLLEQGWIYLTQARYAEGMALLVLASKYVPSEQQELFHSLEALIVVYDKYVKLQQLLLATSMGITDIQKQFQECLAIFQDEQTLFIKGLTSTKKLTQKDFLPRPPDLSAESSFTPPKALNGVVKLQTPELYAICLAPFELRRADIPLELCANRNGQAIFRYLVTQENRSATTDTLMALLWPDDPPDIALNKLYVAVSLLRRSLQKSVHEQKDIQETNKYIIYKQGLYQLDTTLSIRTDIDEFVRLHAIGRKEIGEKSIYYFEQACFLYKRPFLLEDLYANWSFQRREQLRQIYVSMCHAQARHHIAQRGYECAHHWSNKILAENRCDEEAHQHLIRIYALQGRRHDALRQYQLCLQVLQEEMNVDPMPETVTLFQTLMRGEVV